jgi:hypothetical protein
MPLVKGKGIITAVALVVAPCFCLLSLAQVSRPLRSVDRSYSVSMVASQRQLTRHALPEMSPRNLQPRAPYVIGMLPVVPLNHRGDMARLTQCIPALWPLENWPMHRRIAPASADHPEPA